MLAPSPSLQRFQALAQAIIRFRHTVAPVTATQLGVQDGNHRLGDFDAASVNQNLKRAHALLAQLTLLDPIAWPVDDQIDHALLVAALRSDLRTVQEQDELSTLRWKFACAPR